MIKLIIGFCMVLGWGGSLFAATNTFSHRVGDYEIYLLSEGQSEGCSRIFIQAPPEAVKRYTPDGNYPTAVNAFLIKTPDRTILVDAGFGKFLFENLKSLDITPESIDTVLLTHLHGDHIGGLLKPGKPAFPNATLYLAEEEKAYWTTPGSEQVKTLAAYGSRVKTFSPGELGNSIPDLLPGIKPIAAFGHTPGHTLFLITSKEASLLVWGDIAHAMAIQMPVPAVAVSYDVDPKQAVKSRVNVLKHVAEKKIPVAGMHIPYPGIGSVAKDNSGYAFKPVKE